MERLAPLPWQGEVWSRLVAWRERLPHAAAAWRARRRQASFAKGVCSASAMRRRSMMWRGSCAGCRLIAVDNHPDLRWLTPAASMPNKTRTSVMTGPTSMAETRRRSARPSREIVIDQVRKTSEFLSMSSHRGGRRVVPVTSRSIEPPAANALLKMLENRRQARCSSQPVISSMRYPPSCRCILLRAPVPTHAQAMDWLRDVGSIVPSQGLPKRVGRRSGSTTSGDRTTARARPGVARIDHHPAGRPRAGSDRGADRQHNSEGHRACSAIRLLQRWGWDLLAERLAGRVRYYPQHQRQLGGTGAGDRPAAGGGVDCGTGANAGRQRSSVECAFGSGKRLLGYAEAVREQKIGVKATL